MQGESMVFRDLFVLLLVGTCGFSRGMDVEGESFLFRMPQDVQNLVLSHAWDGDKKCYPMYNDKGDAEFLVIPYTLRSIDLMKKKYASTIKLTDRQKKEILLNHQLWVSRNNYGEVRLYRDRADDDQYELDIAALNLPNWMTTKEPTRQDLEELMDEWLGDNEDQDEDSQDVGPRMHYQPRTWFDGINNVNTALIGMCNLMALEPKSIFFLKRSSGGIRSISHTFNSRTIVHADKQSPFLQLDGVLKSVLLHPERNRVMCVVTQGGVSQLHIGDVRDDNSYLSLDVQHFNKPFVKAIYLGKNSYLALTDAGNLATVWLDEANKIQHRMHKQPLRIRDIAVDNSYQTKKTGFKPRIAYVNDGGEVFVTDLTEFGNSITMMHHSTVESPSTIFRLFYDKGQLAVLHCTEEGYGDFIVWPDNLGPLYLKTVLAQKMRQQKNS
jgi:hypothetical protein